MSYNLSRYNRDLNDSFLDFFFGDASKNGNRGFLAMKTDIKEEDNHYILDIEIPGFDKKDISLSLKEGYLTVAVTSNEASDKTKQSFIRRERHYESTSRSYYVGNVDEKEIQASYKDGILSVTLPKEQKDTPHLISIK